MSNRRKLHQHSSALWSKTILDAAIKNDVMTIHHLGRMQLEMERHFFARQWVGTQYSMAEVKA